MTTTGRKWQVRECTFQIQVPEGMANIRFPCSFFFQWKTANGKNHIISKNKVKVANGVIPFADKLQMLVLMVYDTKLQKYKKKDSILLVNLLSNSRPNDPKLVGRVSIDLASVSTGKYNIFHTQDLQYCSVNAWIKFKILLKNEKVTNMQISDLDRSEVSQLQMGIGEIEPKRKEEIRSEVLGSFGVKTIIKEEALSHHKHTPKFNENTVQDRLTQLRAEKAQYSRSSIESSSMKNLSEKSIKSSRHVQFSQQAPQVQVKKVEKDIDMPALNKECSGFESNSKPSENTIRNVPSEKRLNKMEQIPKDGADKMVTKTDKKIQSTLEATIQGSSLKDVIQKQHSPEKSQQQQKMVVENRQKIEKLQVQIQELFQKLSESNQRQNQLEKVVSERQNIINELKNNQRQNQGQMGSMNQLIQIHEKNLKELEQTIENNKYLKGETQILKNEIQMQRKQNEELRIKLEQQAENISTLESKIDQIQQKEPPQPTQNPNSDQKVLELQQQIQELKHKIDSQTMKHENTTMELNEVRQWFGQMQVRSDKLEMENDKLMTQLENAKKQVEALKNEKGSLSAEQQQLQLAKQQISRLNSQKTNLENDKNKQIAEQKEQKQALEQTIIIKQDQIKQLNQKLSTLDDLKNKLEFVQGLSEIKQKDLLDKNKENQQLKQKLKNNQQIVSQFVRIQKQLNSSLDQLTQQYEEKELKMLQLSQDLNLERQKVTELTSKVQIQTKELESLKKSKEDVDGLAKSRMTDMSGRIRQKQSEIARLERQLETAKKDKHQLQFANGQYKQKLKSGQNDKLASTQKIATLENQLKMFKTQLEKQIQNGRNQQIKLKALYEGQMLKRKDLQRTKAQSEIDSQTASNQQIEDLKQKVEGYGDKQNKLRQNIEMMEEELITLSGSLQQRQDRLNQSAQYIAQLNQVNEELGVRVGQLQNQLFTTTERCSALENQVQLLNAYMPEQGNQDQLLELNKKLNQKNKQLLSQLEDKHRGIAELQRDIGEEKANIERDRLKTSREMAQKQILQEKVVALTEDNQKLYDQFKRINMKYEEQLQAIEQHNGQKMTQLMNQIQTLRKNIQQKDRKELDLIKQGNRLRDISQKLQQNINQKQFKIQIQTQELKQIKETNDDLKSKLQVLNNQYQTIYSELGQKQFLLYQANAKVKEVQDKLASEKQKALQKQLQIMSGTKNDEPEPSFKQKIQFFELEIERIQQSQKMKQSQLQMMSNQLQMYRANAQEHTKISKQFQKQIQHTKNTQQQLTQQINNLQTKLKQVNNLITLKNTQYQNIKIQKTSLEQKLDKMQKQRQFFKGQIDHIKQTEPVKQSGRSTPIYQFEESPQNSILNKKDRPDIGNIIDQLNCILARRKEEEQFQGVLRIVIDNNARSQQHMAVLSSDRGAIQEKAKLASKQLQKMKSQIMKNPSRSITQKTQITSLLKPAEQAINQLIHLSQTLAQIDLEQQQEQMQQMQKNNI